MPALEEGKYDDTSYVMKHNMMCAFVPIYEMATVVIIFQLRGRSQLSTVTY